MQHQFWQLQVLVAMEHQRHPDPVEDDAEHQLGTTSPAADLDIQPEHQEALLQFARHVPEPRPTLTPCSVRPMTETFWPAAPVPAHDDYSPPKMAPYSEDEDIEHYLTTF